MRKRYVSFALGGGRYGVPVDQVVQILRLEGLIEIPKPPPFVMGVLNMRGDIIPVVSLRARLELPADKAARPAVDPRKRRVVITRVGGRPYGLDVDEVREIVEFDDGAITEAASAFGGRAEFLLGIARREEELYMILDLARVLAPSRDLPLPGSPG
jgi:purine-binding chemotaxis protein CheW